MKSFVPLGRILGYNSLEFETNAVKNRGRYRKGPVGGVMQKTETLPQNVLALAEELGIGDRLAEIMDVTREIFPGPVTAETGYDPEWPEDRWITFLVEDRSDVKQSIQKELLWNREILDLVPDCPRVVGLSVASR